jgi:hypothetical protein
MGDLHLYIDESGSRMPNYIGHIQRRDGMDYFALGGIMIDEGEIESVLDAHSQITDTWKLAGPLHSTKIRGRRKHFSWLALDAARETAFLSHLENTILALPVIGNACVVDRAGYLARYSRLYAPPWTLCKTAYAILIERSAKFARSQGKRLKVFYEEAGEKEDRDLVEYTKLLKTEGMPFNRNTAKAYGSLEPRDFQDILTGEPQRITKQVPMVQFSDLILYPIAKAGYDETYVPYANLVRSKRLIDCHLDAASQLTVGIKYSCFDRKE